MRFRIETGTLTGKSITGVGYYTRGIATALSEAEGTEVEAFTLGKSAIQYIQPSARLSLRNIPNLSPRIYKKMTQLRIAPAFDRTLHPVDVTLFPDFAIWPTAKSRTRGVVIHDLTFMRYPDFLAKRKLFGIELPVTYWYLSRVVSQAIKRADFIVTVSSSVKDELTQAFGIPPENIIVTPIPPHDEFLAQSVQPLPKSFLMDTYGITTEDYILCVGTLEPRKNHLASLRAYLGLPAAVRQKYSLVFAGGAGWGSDELTEAIRAAKEKGENIIVTGYFDFAHSYSLYLYASLYTSASYYEGFGMPLLEAFAAKTPMVLSDIPVYREVAGSAALYVNPNDTENYTNALEKALTDPALRHTLVTQSTAQLSKYSWESNAQTIIDHCKQLINPKK